MYILLLFWFIRINDVKRKRVINIFLHVEYFSHQNTIQKVCAVRAHETLESAMPGKKSNRFLFAINRAYCACFYSLSAVLVNEGQDFKNIHWFNLNCMHP